MINGNQITDTTPKQNIASFLKSATPGQFHQLNLEQVQLLELQIDNAYSDPLQPNERRQNTAQEMLKRRRRQINMQMEERNRQIQRPSIEKQLQQIRKRKQKLQNWKLIYIMALLGILACIAKFSTNKKISEQNQFDSTGKQIGRTIIQERIPQWSWWIGIVVIVIIIVSFCAFIDTEVVCCRIKLKGVIPRKHDKLEERERDLRQML